MSRNFRKILMVVGKEDNSTPTWNLDDEIRVYNQGEYFVPGVSGNVRYIPKDGKIGGI